MVKFGRGLLAGLIVAALVTAAGAAGLRQAIPVPVPNSFIANPQVTVAGKTVALGGSTTVASTDLSDTAVIARSSNNLSFFSSTTSAQLAGVISDETGTGPLVFATAPTISSLTVTGAFTATGLVTNADLANSSFSLNGASISLGGSRTLSLASSDFLNQGTTTTVLHGNAAGNPSWAQVSNADLVNTATTVNGQSCVLGASCTVTASATTITVGSTAVASGTTTALLYNNGGTLGNVVTLPAANFPALTGDITTSAANLATTLATVNGNVGSFGSSTAIPNFTVNAKGLITAAGTSVVIAPAGTLTGTTLASNVVTASLSTINGNTVPAASDTFALLAASQTLTNKTFNASNNSLSNITTSMFAANVVDNDPALAAQSSTRIPTQSAVYNFVTNALNGIQWKAAVVVRTTANITLSGEQTIDGVLTSASRVLVMAQTSQPANGCYVSAAGAWARCADNASSAQILSSTFFVQQGTLWASSAWTNTNTSTITVGVTNITFGQIAGVNEYTAGTGLQLSANQFSIDSTVATLTGSQSLTNKTISGASNTLSSIALSSLATQATNTVVGNATSGSASPTALAMTSCSSSASAVTWTTNSGFGCNTAVAASTATTATNLAGGAAGALPYQSGSGATSLLAAGSSGQILRSGGAGAPSWSTATYPATAGTAANVLRSDGTNYLSAALAAADLSNGVTGSGAVVLAAAPTITGSAVFTGGVNISGGNGITWGSSGYLQALANGSFWLTNASAGDATLMLGSNTTGSPCLKPSGANLLLVQGGTTTCGATRVGLLALTGDFSSTLSVTGHTTFEGVTSTGATGTGNLMYSASPTTTGTLTAAAANFSGAVTVPLGLTVGDNSNYQFLTLNGPASAGQSGVMAIQRGGVTKAYVGLVAGVLGGTSTDTVIYSSGDAVRIYGAATLAATFASTAVTFPVAVNFPASTVVSSGGLIGVLGAVNTGAGITTNSTGAFLNAVESNTAFNGNPTTAIALTGPGGYWGIRNDTSHNFILGMYNSGVEAKAIQVAQAGGVTLGYTLTGAAANFSGQVGINSSMLLANNIGINASGASSGTYGVIKLNTSNVVSIADSVLTVDPASASNVVAIAAAGLGIGANATTHLPLNVRWDQVGNANIQVSNQSATSAAASAFIADTDGSGYTGTGIQFGKAGGSYTTIGALTANSGYFYSPNAAGLAIIADNASASIRLANLNLVERIRMGSDGSWLIGTTTNVGAGGLSNTGPVFHTGLGTDAALTDRSVCQVVSTGELKYGSGVAGICLGTSSGRYKTGILPLGPGLAEIMRLQPKSFFLDKAHGDPKKQMYGFIAEDMVKVLPKLVGLDAQGRPNTADYLGVVPVLTKAMQEQQGEIIALKAANDHLKHANDNGITTIDRGTHKAVCMYVEFGQVKVQQGGCR